HAARAAVDCPSIATKHVTPHTLRHSAAMALLHAGVDTSVIALWLGHEDPGSTQAYLHADMTIKEQALSRVAPPNTTPPPHPPPPPAPPPPTPHHPRPPPQPPDYAAQPAAPPPPTSPFTPQSA